MNQAEMTTLLGDDIKPLQGFRWPEGLVTSCYITVDGREMLNHGSVITMLNSMLSQARADLDRQDLSHAAKVSARQDLQDLDDWVHQNLSDRAGATTLVWFSCAEHGIQVARWIPVPLPNRLVQAEDFDQTALIGAIRSMPVIGFVLIDHASVRYYHADASQIVEVASESPDMQEKIRARETTFGRKAMMPDAMFGRGNLMEKRLQNRRDHLLYRHIDAVVPRLGRLARANNWSHVLLAGDGRAVHALRNRLTADLQRLKVLPVDLPTRSDNTAVRRFLRGQLDVLRQERFKQEYLQLTEQTMPEMRALRLPEVCKAASLNAIQLLLVETAPPRSGRYCDQCGWLGLEDQSQCEYCQTELILSPHIYDNLADAVLAAGGEVLFSEKQVLPPNMEHVAARLRFPLNEGL